MWKQLASSALIISALSASVMASTYAAFTAEATVSGMSFSTGRAELKLFGNMGYTNAGNNGNLTKTLPGRSYEGIGPFWEDTYRFKYFNTGSVALVTSLSIDYPAESQTLAENIMVETLLWGDTDKDGVADPSDTYTVLAAEQPLSALKTTPVPLGQLDASSPHGVLLKFSTEDMPSETQDQELDFDFIINGTTEGTALSP